MEYTVITTSSQKNQMQEHIDTVNELIKIGWKPQGGIFIDRVQQTFGGILVFYHQAMIKD